MGINGLIPSLATSNGSNISPQCLTIFSIFYTEGKVEPQAGFVLTQTQLQSELITILRRFMWKSPSDSYTKKDKMNTDCLLRQPIPLIPWGGQQQGVQHRIYLTLESMFSAPRIICIVREKTNRGSWLRSVRQSKDQAQETQTSLEKKTDGITLKTDTATWHFPG